MQKPHELQPIADWIRGANRVVVLAGAGISTESGIPDFRGPKGVWTKNPQALQKASIHYYLSDKAVRVASWQRYLTSSMWEAQPNAGHRALVALEQKGRLDTLVTQNVDGLHQKAGSSPERIIEIHGTVWEVKCLSCGETAPMERALARVRAGEDDPNCRSCSGILKAATISFDQQMVAADVERAELAASSCDIFLAVGTSLVVYPVALLPQIALDAGARLVIVNAEPTPFDGTADAVVNGKLGVILPELVSLV